MKPCVLVAGPPPVCRRFSEAVSGHFAVMTCFDRMRAAVLVDTGRFQAIATAGEFLPESTDVVRIDVNAEPTRVLELVTAAVERRRAADRVEAAELVNLGTLKYDEYMEFVRFRATRDYLLGLMQRHRGSVTHASRSAGIVRESLHRLLRRHDVDADAFRDP
jgi:transcriptional regulator of acetoin/glycerol metabolism